MHPSVLRFYSSSTTLTTELLPGGGVTSLSSYGSLLVALVPQQAVPERNKTHRENPKARAWSAGQLAPPALYSTQRLLRGTGATLP